MAITADSVWEIRPGGNENNGSVFSTSLAGATGIDYTQQDTAQATFTNGTGNGTTTLASADNPFTPQMVGNGVGIIEGATYRGVWQITAYIGAGSVTVDRNLPAGGAMTGRVGGANRLASNGIIFIGNMVAGNKIWVRGPGADAGDYLIASNSITLSTAGSASNPITVEGYTTTRGDGGRPTIKWSASAINMLQVSAIHQIVKNLTLDGGTSGTFAFAPGAANCYYQNIVAKNAQPARVGGAGAQTFVRCRFTSSESGAPGLEVQAGNNQFYECIIDNNTGHGVEVEDVTWFHDCIINDNTLDGVNYAAAVDFGFHLKNCDIWNNGRDGVRIESTAGDGGLGNVVIQKCILGENAGYEINYTPADIEANTGAIEWAGALLDCNAFYSTGSGAYNNLPANDNDLILTGSPFTSSTDFSLNDTAGAGAAVQAANCGAAFADGVNTGSYPLGALGAPGAASVSGLMGMRSWWREYTGELDTETIDDEDVVDLYLDSGLEATNRRLEYHYTTDSSSVDLVAGTQEYTLPTDCEKILWLSWGGRELKKADVEQWRRAGRQWRDADPGEPLEWAHEGNRLLIWPTPSADAVAKQGSPVFRYHSKPGTITTYGPAQLMSEHWRIPVYWGVVEWSMAHPDSALAVHRIERFTKLFETEITLAAGKYKARGLMK